VALRSRSRRQKRRRADTVTCATPTPGLGPRCTFAGTAAFDFRLIRTARFGDEVLWLAPENPQPFRNLTQLVHTAFPDFPPYEGQLDHIVHHLTVGHGSDVEQMKAAERAVQRHLPIRGQVREVTLLVQVDGHISRVISYSTSPRSAPGSGSSHAGK
jgi:hypothetical protein